MPKLPHRIVVTILFFLSVLTFTFGQKVITIDDNTDVINSRNFEFEYLIDPDRSKSISDIRNGEESLIIDNAKTGFAPGNHHIWVHFRTKYVGDNDNISMVLELAHAHLAQYEIFIYNQDSLILHQDQGDNYPHHHRAVEHNYFLHPVFISKGNTYDVYYKLNPEGQEVPFRLNIYRRGHFVKINAATKLFHGFVLGFCWIISIITFILFILFKKRFYLLEVLISIFSIIYILSEEGYGYMYLWSQSPWFQGVSRPLFVGGLILTGVWFTVDFLKINSRNSRLYTPAMYIVGIYILFLIFIHPFNILGLRTYDNVGNVILSFMVLTILIGGIVFAICLFKWYKSNDRDSLMLLLVFGITILLLVIRTLGIEGILQNSQLVQHTGFITRVLHIPILSIYLLYNASDIITRSQRRKIRTLKNKDQANQILVEGINEERKRVAMAIHDSAGSMITGLKANFESMTLDFQPLKNNPKYNTSLKLIQELSSELRTISNNLYPNTLQKLGLQEEIKRLLGIVITTHNIKTHLETNDQFALEGRSDLQLQLYYIINEAINNAVVHSKAENIWVQMNEYDSEINIIIEDDGCGFELEKAQNKSRNGLKNIEYRVKVLDGDMDLYTRLNKGTSISINIPL